MSDLDDDYKNIRKNLYDLAAQGDEAIQLMMELARESEHPRAFEVLGQLIKQNAEISEKLMKLQKQTKEVKNVGSLSNTGGNDSITNNNIFVGSTTDLQRILRDETVIEHDDNQT